MMTYDDIRYEMEGPVLYITFDRPDKHNAMRMKMGDELIDALKRAERDDDVKVIVLRGNGPSFCSGHDLNEVGFKYGFQEGKTEEERRHRPSQRVRLISDRRLMERYLEVQYSLKPIIAQVHGVCQGGGLFIVESADLAICADDTRFSHKEQRLAFGGNTWSLNAEILTYGPKKARELLLLGEEFDGPAAERMGLVNRSVAPDDLDETVRDWAERIARMPKDAIVMGKAIHQQALDSFGYSAQLWRGYVGHTLATNIRFDEDEFNFFKARRDAGTRNAFHGRDEHFDTD